MEKYLANLLLYLLVSFKKMFATITIFIIYLYILMLPDFLAFDIWSHQIAERNVCLLLI